MNLRPHQELAIEMLRASLASGKKRPLLAAPCSFGKTITAAAMLKSALDKGKRGIFICDRIKLVQQSLEAFDHHGLPFGVMQGNHELTNPHAPIQIASIQTLARRKNMVDFDFAIVDEAHTLYEYQKKMMEAYDNVPFIGLSATPFSKGLGKYYDDLIVPATAEDLLSDGYLCPVDYYGGKQVALEGVKTRQLSTGGTDYDPESLAHAVEEDKTLTGSIVNNWVKHAWDRQTIAFSPSIKHSKFLVDQFRSIGIKAEHIDGYMDDEIRQELYEAHDAGEFLILSCSRLLNVGYDAPQVSCLIDCFPTRSYIAYVQRAGRIMRTAPGKDRAIYLDHAGNVKRFGFAEAIVPDELDSGEKRFQEKQQVKEKKESKVSDCPQCYRQMVGVRCSCGYEIPMTKQIHTDESDLVQLTKQANKVYTPERKSQFYGELLYYANTRGYSRGWAAHKYRAKFGVWPNKVTPVDVYGMSDEVSKFIKSQNIRSAYARMKNDSRNNPQQIQQGTQLRAG